MKRVATLALMGATVVIGVLIVVGTLIGPGYVEELALERAIVEHEVERGAPEPDVSCTDDLYREVGETVDCTSEAPDGSETPFVARVRSVEDSGVRFTVTPTR